MQVEIKAVSRAGQLETFSSEHADIVTAVLQAEERGFRVLDARERRAGRFMPGSARGSFPLLPFSRELLSLLEAGLSLTESLDALVEKEPRAAVRGVLTRLVHDLREGRSLSQALERQPDAFPALYVATIRASEQTGDLPEALGRFVSYQAQADLLKRTVVSASIYPLLLIGVGTLVALFLLVYLVPRFSTIYGDMGKDLPWASRLLLGWGSFIDGRQGLVAAGAAGAALLAWFGLSSTAMRGMLVRPLWRIGPVRDRVQVYFLGRFYRTVGMLLRSGIPALTALEMARGMLPSVLADGVDLARAQVRDGEPLSAALADNGLTTPIAARMLRVGERTGQMAEMFERTGRIYEDEVTRWLDWFIKLLEPLLMVFIGAIIGTVVLLMYMPIFELAGTIQ
ncbi:MAG: type II secretion system F family protein [bacterium]|jgi:general secretion pathway protein F|nr:type II secretion system F family protein [Betaproteobacteria bacterium]